MRKYVLILADKGHLLRNMTTVSHPCSSFRRRSLLSKEPWNILRMSWSSQGVYNGCGPSIKEYTTSFKKIGHWHLENLKTWASGLSDPFESSWTYLMPLPNQRNNFKQFEKDMIRYPRPWKGRPCPAKSMIRLFGKSYIISRGQYSILTCIGWDRCRLNDTAKYCKT